MSTIGIIDYGSGNFQSVFNALEYLGLNIIRVNHKNNLGTCSHLVLPGVGAFAAAMRRLSEISLIEPLKEVVLEKTVPFLGICVGMQILADIGNEFEIANGLGLISGTVEKINTGESRLPIPHIGWSKLIIQKDNPLFARLSSEPCFYFLHSYSLRPGNQACVLATVNYGNSLTACVGCDNIFGVQFHPEKSQRDGLQLLRNFCLS